MILNIPLSMAPLFRIMLSYWLYPVKIDIATMAFYPAGMASTFKYLDAFVETIGF